MGGVDSVGRRERLATIIDRDGPFCVWCGRRMDVGAVRATTDHVVPKLKGGPSWIENEVAACAGCNHKRGHISPAEWAQQCELLGLDPQWGLILQRLEELDAALVERSGHRRARPYVSSQLRRMRRWNGG